MKGVFLPLRLKKSHRTGNFLVSHSLTCFPALSAKQISQEKAIQIPRPPLGLMKREVTEARPVIYLISCLEASKKHLDPEASKNHLGPQPVWPSPPQLSTLIPHHSTPPPPCTNEKTDSAGGGKVIAHSQI